MKNLFEVNEIAADHITVSGERIAVEWSKSVTGQTLTAFYHMDETPFKVRFSAGTCGDLFTAAKRALETGEPVRVDPDDLMIVIGTAQPVPVRKPATAPAAPNPDKQRHGEVPEKLFVGSELTGPCWRILFDGDAGKTRVIFDRKPARRILDAVKAAGFYWSPSMRSWNKGLTFRAFRAAEKLHAELHTLTA